MDEKTTVGPRLFVRETLNDIQWQALTEDKCAIIHHWGRCLFAWPLDVDDGHGTVIKCSVPSLIYDDFAGTTAIICCEDKVSY